MTENPPQPKTHYEILRVETDVSAEDLRTAYRVLSRRYHPDRHPTHAEAAARIMASINVAYDVLSDPDRRSRYDREIGVFSPRRAIRARPQRRPGRYASPATRSADRDPRYPPGAGAGIAGDPMARRRALAVRRMMTVSMLSCAAGVLIILWVLFAPAPVEDEPDLSRIVDARDQRAADSTPWRQTQRSAGSTGRADSGADARVHIRPLESPIGQPWPSVSGELPGYARQFADGELGLLLDNRLGPSDVFAKVYRVNDDGLMAGRHAFVRARDRLPLDGFPPGEYEVHYFSLDTGQTLRSVPLQLSAAAQGRAPLEFRLDDMQGRSGRAKPMPHELFASPAVVLKLTRQLPARTP